MHWESENCSGELPEPLPIFCFLGIAEIMVSNWVSSRGERWQCIPFPYLYPSVLFRFRPHPSPHPPPFLVVSDPVPRSLEPQGCWAWYGELLAVH